VARPNRQRDVLESDDVPEPARHTHHLDGRIGIAVDRAAGIL
jgi:hypothetical protein